jgi:hypothetical protein
VWKEKLIPHLLLMLQLHEIFSSSLFYFCGKFSISLLLLPPTTSMYFSNCSWKWMFLFASG